LGAKARDPWDPDREAIAKNPDQALDDLARRYTKEFQERYDELARASGGRSYADIVSSASSANEELLRQLTAQGGVTTDVQDLDHAIRSKEADAIKSVLQRQRTKKAVDELIRDYEKPQEEGGLGHGEGSLRQTLFGIAGDPKMAAEYDRWMSGALL